MREYGKVVPRFWTGGTGAQLRGDLVAQLAAVYLSTCPSASPIGIFYLPIVTMAHEMGVTVERVRAALVKLRSVNFAEYDEAESLVWVPAMARVSFGNKLSAGDKRRPWMLRELDQHKRHRFFRAFVSLYGSSYGVIMPADAPPEALPSPSQGTCTVGEMEQGAGAVDGAVDPSGGSAAHAAPAPAPRAKPRRTSGESGEPKPDAPLHMAWRTWRDEYARRYGGSYSSNRDTDGKAMKAAVASALEQLETDGRPAADLEPLLRWRWRAYLADPGSRDFSLREHKHGLQWFSRGIPAYGTPWGRQQRAPPDRPPPAIVEPRRPTHNRAMVIMPDDAGTGPPGDYGPDVSMIRGSGG